MKTKNQHKGLFTLSICFVFLILIAFIILTFKPGQQSNQPDIDEAEFVLIRKFNLGGAVYPGSGNALLFDNPQQIRKIYTYVKSTRYDNHACAWHFVVEFYDKDMESIEKYYVNQECSYYNKRRMKPYFEDIENNPTHYIYDLIISPSIDPMVVLKDLRAQKHIPLPLEKTVLQQDSEIYDIEIPKAYIINVVDNELNLQTMKTKLMNQFTYIEDVVPFPQASYYGVQ
jgi:hypothetical protein